MNSRECDRLVLPVSASARTRKIGVFLICLVSLSACYSPERNLIQDPFNTPLIHILESRFDPVTAAVDVRWEYLGTDPLLRVVILRRSGPGFDSIGVVDGGTPVGTDRFVDSYRDTRPLAGELLEYTVSARTPRGQINARAVQVQIPGARLLRLRRNPFQGRIQIDWQPVGGNLVSFEVLRSTAGSETSLVTMESNESSFVDREINGNTPYTYRVVTGVSGGGVLRSGTLTAGVYSLERTEPVGAEGGRLVVASGSSASSVTMFALVTTPGGVDISSYRYIFGASFDGRQTVGVIREKTVTAGLDDVASESLTLVGPSAFRPASTVERLFVVGRNAAGTNVRIKAFSLPNLTPVWDGPRDWILSDATTPVVAAQAGDGNVYFAADRSLRVYTSSLFEIATYDLPFSSPSDLDGDSQNLWAVIFSEKRIMRTDIGSGLGTTLIWENVDLPVSGLSPAALTLNRFGQLFVLDAAARCVHVFDTDLSLLLSWSLPDEDFNTGGITLDGGSGNLIHVSSSNGLVFTYLP